MTLSEKAAYLKGLMDGIKLDTEKDENRLLKAVVDLLQDMAVSIDDLEDNAIAVSDELDEIEENLDAIDAGAEAARRVEVPAAWADAPDTPLEAPEPEAPEFIRNIRLEQAARLLKEQKINVTQVAYTVGFSNLAHFSTIFRKHFGVSPSEYASIKEE